MQTHPARLIPHPSGIDGDKIEALKIDATAFYQDIAPEIPAIFLDVVDEHGQVVLSAQQRFDQVMRELSVRREIMNRVHNVEQCLATIDTCEGLAEEINHNLRHSPHLIPGLRQKIKGQIADALARAAFARESIALYLMEIAALKATMRRD